MATVRITGSTTNNIHKRQWLGTLPIDKAGHIERKLDLPEATYLHIEEKIGVGHGEGTLQLDDGRRIDWFLDGEVKRST